MGDPRHEVMRAITDLIDANLVARAQLEENERLLRLSISQIEEGTAIGEILRSLPTVEERSDNTTAVQSFYARRIDLRTAIIRAALDEGMTVSELAAVFGIPHEVIASHVARTAAEPDKPE